jgi:hypothetical protein
MTSPAKSMSLNNMLIIEYSKHPVVLYGRETWSFMSSSVPTMTTLIYLFYSPLESHRSTRFGVFPVHSLQEHLMTQVRKVSKLVFHIERRTQAKVYRE